jgi:hypothetical protein
LLQVPPVGPLCRSFRRESLRLSASMHPGHPGSVIAALQVFRQMPQVFFSIADLPGMRLTKADYGSLNPAASSPRLVLVPARCPEKRKTLIRTRTSILRTTLSGAVFAESFLPYYFNPSLFPCLSSFLKCGAWCASRPCARQIVKFHAYCRGNSFHMFWQYPCRLSPFPRQIARNIEDDGI